jgi:hypothetical protein
MRGKSDAVRSAPRAAERERGEGIRSELERRGISDEFARAVAKQLEPFSTDLAPEQFEAVLSGVALAYGVHRRSIDAFRRTVTELEEVQVLLGSFGSELRKLDEAVEILAAYAARLRQSTSPPPPRNVH